MAFLSVCERERGEEMLSEWLRLDKKNDTPLLIGLYLSLLRLRRLLLLLTPIPLLPLLQRLLLPRLHYDDYGDYDYY